MYHNYRVRYTIRGFMLAMMLALGSLLLPNIARTVFAQDDADFTVTFSGPSYVTSGGNITYEFEVKNHRDVEITDLTFYDSIPANTTYVSGGTFNGSENRAEFSIASLPANATQTVTLVVQVNNGVALNTVIENKDFDIINWYLDSDSLGYYWNPSEGIGTIVEAPGTLVAVYKDANGTPYQVEVDGYHFDNFGNDAPRNFDDDLGAEDLFALFGPAACQSGDSAATCKLSGPAKKWMEGQIKGMDAGHCEGMAVTSLRLFEGLPFKSMSLPSDFQSGASTTIDISLPQQSIENYIASYFVRQFFDKVTDTTINSSANDIVDQLIADFNAPESKAYALGFYRLEGPNEEFTHGHAVAAYGVEKVNDNEYRILIYDNNYPKQRKYITVNRAENTWSYVTSATPGEPADLYTGRADTKNLEITPISARELGEDEYFACPFCNDETVTAAKAQAIAAGQVAGTIRFEYANEGAYLVINDEDQATGFDFNTETFINEIPDADVNFIKGGLNKEIPPTIDVPYVEADDALYSVFISGNTIDSVTDGALTITGEGYAMGLDFIQLEPDELLELAVSPDGDLIAFSATETVLAPAMYISYDPLSPDDASVIFEVDGVVLDAGEEVALELDPDLERVYFDDTGALGQEFDVTMTLIWPDGDQEDYVETIYVPEGSTSAFIDFGAWDGLSHPSIYVDDILQNPLANHRIKLESVIGTYDPTPQANAPAGVYHVEATFTNVTEVALNDVYFTVADLAEGNVVLNADGGPAGVDAEVLVPTSALGDNELLDANESFTFGFDVGLANADASELTVNVNGEPWDWTPNVDPPASYDANDESFVFAVATGDLLASCGGYDIIQTASGDIVAPGFTGNIVVGTDGADILNGSNGDDLIVGLKGHDEIKGKQGDDILCGNEGQDIIRGGNGDDYIDGGAGPDWLVGNNGQDTIYGGAGADDLEGNNGADTLRGGLGADVLLGGRDSDDLQGDEGQDYIAGGHHDDLIDGGLGRDLLYGDNGNDTITGNDAGDELYGNKGDDTLDGGNGNDFCDGGKGTNSIVNCEGASATSVQGEYTAEELSIRQELIDRAATHPAEDTLFLPLFTK